MPPGDPGRDLLEQPAVAIGALGRVKLADVSRVLDGVVPGIVDAHIHQWDPFTTPREGSRVARAYKRAPGLVERIFPLLAGQANREGLVTARHVLRPYLPADYATDVRDVPAAVGAPVEALIHVEASWHGPDPADETRWVEALPFGEDGTPRLAAIVGHADPRAADFAATLDAHRAASERFRGIRCMAAWHPDPKVRNWSDGPGILRAPEFLRGFAALAERELTFDAYVYSHQLRDVRVLAEEYPDTTIVLDHFAPLVGWLGPMGRATGQTDAERAEIFSHWQNALAALAEHRNVVAKLSGFAFPALGLQEARIGRAALAELAAPLIDHTVDSFGGDRVIWGSNFPMDKAISTYVDVAGALADVLAPRGPDLLARVFRANALRAYRLARAE